MFAGKKWHMTTSGKVLPYPEGKVGDFQQCMSKNTKGKMNKGKKLSEVKLNANKKVWSNALDVCAADRVPAKK